MTHETDGYRPEAPDGVIRKAYRFTDFEEWPHELFAAIEDFADEFGIHPNIMCAGTEVYSEIDRQVMSDLENVVNDEGEHPTADDEVVLAGFQADECDVEFTVTSITPYPVYLLIYDADPSFDGEPEHLYPGSNILATRHRVA